MRVGRFGTRGAPATLEPRDSHGRSLPPTLAGLAFHVNRAGLGSFLSGLFVEPDPVPRLEPIEVAVHHAVPVEVDLPAIVRLDESAIHRRLQPDDAPAGHFLVDLDVAVAAPHVILEATARRVERIPYRDVDILMGVVETGLAVHEDF